MTTEIIEKIEKMTVVELNDLVKELEEKFGVSAAAPMAMAAAPAAAAGEEAAVKDSFDVVLTSAGDKKIAVLKAVRELTGQGLKEAKAMVDATPATVKEGASKEEAEEIKAKLEAEGATIELK